MFRPALLLVALVAAASPAVACSVYDAPVCHYGADCASGVCNGDGTCAPAATSSSSGASGTSSASSGGMGAGGTASSSSSGSGAGGGATCKPADPATITAAEVPLQAGLHATFRVADNAMFDTQGTAQPDGSRVWDLTVAFSGDHALILDTLPLDANLWFAKDYYPSLPAPSNYYAAKLSDTQDLLGVFEMTPAALLLHGVASSTSSATATEMLFKDATLQPATVTVLQFPLTSGASWTSQVNVAGVLDGIPIGGVYTQTYTSKVDAHGLLKTPYADFQVLRVNTGLLVFLNGISTTTVTQTFVTGCFGTVGTIVSESDDTAADFTQAAEIWRFAP